VPELDKLRRECNFTKEERFLFELRAEDIPLEQCAEIMNLSISAVKAKSQKINRKIERIDF
jgi:DNA-binding CsgD family transcriptional regulator